MLVAGIYGSPKPNNNSSSSPLQIKSGTSCWSNWHLLQDSTDSTGMHMTVFRNAFTCVTPLLLIKKHIPCPMISSNLLAKSIIRHPFFPATAHLRFSQTKSKTKLHYCSSILRAFSLCLEFGGNNRVHAKHKLGARFAHGWRKCFHACVDYLNIKDMIYLRKKYIYSISFHYCKI